MMTSSTARRRIQQETTRTKKALTAKRSTSGAQNRLKCDLKFTSTYRHTQILRVGSCLATLDSASSPAFLLSWLLFPLTEQQVSDLSLSDIEDLTTNYEMKESLEASSSINSLFLTPNTISTVMMSTGNYRRSSLVMPSPMARRRRRKKKKVILIGQNRRPYIPAAL